MRIAAALLGLSLFAAGPALASDWAVDQGKSRLGFSGVQVGAPFQGRFARWEAHITFDPAKPGAGHATVLIDTASARTGDTQRDEALPQADWFDSSHFPQARFEATSFRAKGGDAFEAVGTLSIRGLSHDAVLPFTLTVAGDTAHAQGRLQLVRTQFGVGQGAWASGQWVALDVGVDVDLTATRVPGS
jgi:polyisoprenoid-binding protein YceI